MKIMNLLVKLTIAAALSVFIFQSCNYLDMDQNEGMSEEEVFGTYANFKSFLNLCYEANGGNNKACIMVSYPMYFDWNGKTNFAWVSTTDAADCGRLTYPQVQFKTGFVSQEIISQYTFSTTTAHKPVVLAMFSIIRIANKCIANIDMLTNATQQEKDDLLGQAYFIRAYAHFALARFIGGVPYLDKALQADDEWDIPRLPLDETYERCAQDFHIAYELMNAAGKMRRDAGDLNFSAYDKGKPNGCVALAFKAKSLVYAASPLANPENDIIKWEAAAESAGEALNAALEWGYSLVTKEQYKSNFSGQMNGTNEILWYYIISQSLTANNLVSMFSKPQSGSNDGSGITPTQNFVDKFETRWGDALNTEADRKEASLNGHYNEQDPYSNRDPRLDFNIVYDGWQSSAVNNTAPYNSNEDINSVLIHYDPITKSYPQTRISGVNQYFGIIWGSQDGSNGCGSSTGYYMAKYWNGKLGSKVSGVERYMCDPLVRLAEIYLLYAEAVNEAYGPYGSSENNMMTALDAVNCIRARVDMPPVIDKYLENKEIFRERIRNERCVELAYEGNHYYFDIRRWKTAPQSMSQKLYGMYVEKTDKSEAYPKGRKYIRTLLPENRQSVWKDYMYFFPLPDVEANKMEQFVNYKWQ